MKKDIMKYDQNTVAEKVFDFVYDSALRDAVLQQAFKGEKHWISEVNEAKELVRAYVDRLLNGGCDGEREHDAFFLKTANKICIAVNGRKPENVKDSFSFGNAQKLLNMSVKYLYILCYDKPEQRSCFAYCHCPLDSIMVNIVWKRYLEQKDKDKEARKKDLKPDFCSPWGCEGLNDEGKQPELTAFPARYAAFQKAVKTLIGEGDVYPIEFDYLVWKQ